MKSDHSLQRQHYKHGKSRDASFPFTEPTRLFAPVPVPSAPVFPYESQEHPAHVAQFRHSFDRISIRPPVPDRDAGYVVEQSGIQQVERQAEPQEGEALQKVAAPNRVSQSQMGLPNGTAQQEETGKQAESQEGEALQKVAAPSQVQQTQMGQPDDTAQQEETGEQAESQEGEALQKVAAPSQAPQTQTSQPDETAQQEEAEGQAESQEGEALQRVTAPSQAPQNRTGLPDSLKAGVESLSGLSLDDVRVHYNSAKPAQVDALAYTQGTEIHVGPGQEGHLPHEAWHVVQQMQERVRPTLQTKGVAINDDQGLEREADVMGTIAKTTQPEDGVLNRSAQVSGEVQLKSVIQRAVGYEFETDWLVEKRRPFGMGRQPLRKKDAIGNRLTFQPQGFKLEADEAARGRSDIEFIVDPPVEEGPTGLAQLQATMANILQVGTRFTARSGRPFFGLNEVTHVPADEAFIITPGEINLRAGPQATLGIDLRSIARFLQMNKSAHLARAGAPGNPKLNGLLLIIRQYLQKGLREIDPDTGLIKEVDYVYNYPKEIGQPLLARTDFATLFSLIEPDRQQYYRQNDQNREKWVKDVMNFAGLDNGRQSDDILDRGVIRDRKDMDQHRRWREQLAEVERSLDKLNKDPKQSLDKTIRERNLRGQREWFLTRIRGLERHAGLSVSDWLLGILDGTDRLTEIEDAESMGALADKVDLVGPARDIKAGIFEFRGEQETKIPLTRWSNFAERHFRTIMELNATSNLMSLDAFVEETIDTLR